MQTRLARRHPRRPRSAGAAPRWLAGWLPTNLLPLAPLLSETTAVQMQGPLAAVWLHERFELHHARLVAWRGQPLANRLCVGVSILLLLLLLFLPGHDTTRGDVRLQLDANGCKALVSSSALGCGCNACHVPIWGHTLCRLFFFTSHPAHRRRFVSLFRIPTWICMACLSRRVL
jgi:hypothetical protein